MSTFWQVFLAVIAAWAVTRIVGNWLLGKVLRTAEKSDRVKVQGAERVAVAVADELERRAAPAPSESRRTR